MLPRSEHVYLVYSLRSWSLSRLGEDFRIILQFKRFSSRRLQILLWIKQHMNIAYPQLLSKCSLLAHLFKGDMSDQHKNVHIPEEHSYSPFINLSLFLFIFLKGMFDVLDQYKLFIFLKNTLVQTFYPLVILFRNKKVDIKWSRRPILTMCHPSHWN